MIKEGIYTLKVQRAYRKLLSTVRRRVPGADLELIQRAFRFADNAHKEQKRLSGEPYIIHPVEVAQILADQGMDTPTLAAALMHDVVEDTEYGEDSITSNFGEEINSLVKAVTKISTVKKKGNTEDISRQKEKEAAENIRMMLLATARDVRVVIIKLADKLHNMRTLEFHRPDKRRRIAGEVLSIYAPIAGRMGMYRMKSELEDLAFSHVEPERYAGISEGIKDSRSELEKFVKNVSKVMRRRLEDIKIEARVEGRAKHHYSIHQKMVSQGKKLQEIYDILGIRIIVRELRDCYGTLGIVHTLWPPIQGRFKDYIATPKINGYQSLHTTVVGPDGKPLEIQIRTEAMNDMADYGVAAHWAYKNEEAAGSSARMRWIQRLSGMMEGASDTGEFIEDLRSELSPEEVYVFTPRGDVLDLPRGSTVLDFAFRVHTEIGLRCRGAVVNERIVPLRTELKSGDRVEILTEKTANPSPSWLRYIKSPRSKQKLRSPFRKLREDEQNATPPRETAPRPETGSPSSGVPAAEQAHEGELRIRRRKTQDPKRVPIEVAGARDIPVRYAGCCSPVPGDRIVGFITRGRGVTVHRADCSHLPSQDEDQARIIAVGWEGLTEKYPVAIEVRAGDRQGLYLDLVGGITRTYTNILKAEADIPRHEGALMKARFLIEVEHVDHLDEIIDSLESVPGVVSVQRVPDKNRRPPAPRRRGPVKRVNG